MKFTCVLLVVVLAFACVATESTENQFDEELNIAFQKRRQCAEVGYFCYAHSQCCRAGVQSVSSCSWHFKCDEAGYGK
ncbi:conotoxin ArMKLT2-0111-like [Lineus longissimus]|uniref:conotoxin ArMKLT2-0111-like n=1 Tax=Lineus longissimus TaxID=88925 RepID=UPI00315D9D6E